MLFGMATFTDVLASILTSVADNRHSRSIRVAYVSIMVFQLEIHDSAAKVFTTRDQQFEAVSDPYPVLKRSRQLLILGRLRRKANPDRPSGHLPPC